MNKVCPICKKEFHPAHFYNIFCSRKCSVLGRKGKTAYSRIIIKCDFCQKKFFRSKFKREKHRHNFCSPKCYYLYKKEAIRGEKNPNWKGGISKIKNSGHKELRLKGINTIRIGLRYENEVKKILENLGFFCIKSIKSFGIWDIWAVNEKELKLIQVKVTSSNLDAKILFKKTIEKMRSIKVLGNQELWIRRKKRKIITNNLLDRYEIIKINE